MNTAIFINYFIYLFILGYLFISIGFPGYPAVDHNSLESLLSLFVSFYELPTRKRFLQAPSAPPFGLARLISLHVNYHTKRKKKQHTHTHSHTHARK